MNDTRWKRVLVLALTVLLAVQGCSRSAADTDWPKATAQNHPWTRWWWMGSAVDKENLAGLLTQYHDAGLGGVEICPIYGVKEYEDQFIDFLSPKWMDMLGHTMQEGKALGFGVDMTTGTGWPFGGPQVTDQTASMKVQLEKYTADGGKTFTAKIPKDSKGKLSYLLAVSGDGTRIELTDRVKDGRLEWEAPAGSWTIYEVATRGPIQRVKRAAPGGGGYVVDPYSVSALDDYLAYFDKHFSGFEGPMPRSQFHDSFEYFDATWTRDFFDQFQRLRGYDLREKLEALFGDGPSGTVARVKSDYRETISDLHLAYIQRWTEWCHGYGSLSRNQAHGAPGNLIDLYGAADIPETEIFRAVDEKQIPMLKFSSSAAHLKGTPLASSESFTWLREHFHASLDDVKYATDFLFLCGVNHIFFHGIPYSPQQADWPGWQFYASVNFGPDGGLWHDLPSYTAYVTRCQSILQAGKPDNDILLYWPIYDFWKQESGLNMPFRIHNQDEWLYPSAFYRTAMTLWKKGYTYDAVSDAFLQQASCRGGKIVIHETEYDVIVVPHCQSIPAATMKKLMDLVREGATVVFQDSLPKDVPGLANLEQRRKALEQAAQTEALQPYQHPVPADAGPLPPATLDAQVGKGRILLTDLETMLSRVPIAREAAMDSDIRFERRRSENGFDYFLVNRGRDAFDGWMTLGKPAQSAVLMDPRFENRTGWAAVRKNGGSTQVYLQLQPEQSAILRTFTDTKAGSPKWQYVRTTGKPIQIEGDWDVAFIEGGPTLPEAYRTKQLASWTDRDDPEAKRFSGTARYTLEFDLPDAKAADWMLDLGKVCESARVRLNGEEIAALWARPYRCRLGSAARPGKNKLEIEVTNLAANRIRDLDRQGVVWKKFYDINIVNIDYKPLNAADWPLLDSGLLGPVTLQGLSDLSITNLPQESTDRQLSLFIIGDSTVHNSSSGIQGWGDVIADYFDPSKVSVHNYARGGRSSRTFVTEGLWDKVLEQVQPGDFVLMQFGHNDGGPLNTGRARASLKGVGDQTQEVIMESTGKPEVIHTYGWYMQKYITDTKAKGGVPIVCSPVPRDRWKDGKTIRASEDYGKWAAETARANGAFFVDLNELIAEQYDKLGPEKVNKEYFFNDHTHTSPAGARLNAEMAVEGIRDLKDCPLSRYLVSSAAR